MTNLPSKENVDLIPYRFDLEIIGDVIRQLQKDVLLSGGTLEIPEQGFSDIILLKNIISDFVSQISLSNAELLFNLLYRVDIPQQIIEQQPGNIADLILKRALLKVLTRKFYGKQE